MPLLVCLYRRTNDGGGVQSSAWQRPISIRGFGTAAVNTPQSSSQGSNTRNSVTTSTPPASYPPHSQTQSPQPGNKTINLLKPLIFSSRLYHYTCNLFCGHSDMMLFTVRVYALVDAYNLIKNYH